MAEIRVSGNEGDFAWGDTNTGTQVNGSFNTWNANITQNIGNVTRFGDSWTRKRAGIREGTFSASGILTYNLAKTSPNVDTMAIAGVTLTVATGCTIAGQAIPGSVGIDVDKQGDTAINMDAEFDGAITLAWDETP